MTQQYPHNPQPYAPQQPPKKHTLRTILIVLATVFVGLPVTIGIIGAALGGTDAKAPTAVTTKAAAPVTSAPATTQPTIEPTTEAPPPPPETTAPELSVSQEQAIKSAEAYIDYGAFSRKGLIDQLEYEDFTAKEAAYAADHITVNWMTEADQSAAAYLETGSFSHSGLMDQLLYEGFTRAQAAHGVKSVGL
jgi:hypothetical protein